MKKIITNNLKKISKAQKYQDIQWKHSRLTAKVNALSIQIEIQAIKKKIEINTYEKQG